MAALDYAASVGPHMGHLISLAISDGNSPATSVTVTDIEGTLEWDWSPPAKVEYAPRQTRPATPVVMEQGTATATGSFRLRVVILSYVSTSTATPLEIMTDSGTYVSTGNGSAYQFQIVGTISNASAGGASQTVTMGHCSVNRYNNTVNGDGFLVYDIEGTLHEAPAFA